MLNQIKEKLATKKGIVEASAPVLGTMALATPVFAEDPSGNVTAGMTTALQTAFGAVQTDVVSVITTALPYALGIMALTVALRIGIKFFKGIANR